MLDNNGDIPVLSSTHGVRTELGVPNLSRSMASVACNCTAMRKASRRVSQMYDAALAPAGLKATQFAILSEIDRRAERLRGWEVNLCSKTGASVLSITGGRILPKPW